MSEYVGQTASRRDAGKCLFPREMPISKEKAEKEQKEREASPEEGGEPESRVPQRQEAGISGRRCVL